VPVKAAAQASPNHAEGVVIQATLDGFFNEGSCAGTSEIHFVNPPGRGTILPVTKGEAAYSAVGGDQTDSGNLARFRQLAGKTAHLL
jgi:hypothetical protein